MKISTWNVNGIRARADEVKSFVEREAPDVLCLQEVKASPEQVPEALLALPGYHALWHGHKGYSGVALLLRRETFANAPLYAHPEFDHETRIVTARAGDLVFASIYVPNGGKDFPAKLRFLEAMEAMAARAQADGTRLVLCGDLNVAREVRDIHPSLRNEEQIGQTPHERALLERIIARGLVDLSRKFAPDDDRLYSWWAPWRNMKQKNVGWRLDYVLANAGLAEKATSCAVFREYGTSDHGPVQAVLDVAVPAYAAAPPRALPQRPAQEDAAPKPKRAKRQLKLI